MKTSIVELVARKNASEIQSLLEKTLAQKLVRAISAQTRTVARDAYGSMYEAFGSDDRPEFMNPDDNRYARFFATALIKFGVNGPEDFQDEKTKQEFFKYVDANWRAQDSVQSKPQLSDTNDSFDAGTQTALPQRAAQPLQQLPQDGASDPSTSVLAPVGSSIDAVQPGNVPSTDDPGFNAAQTSCQTGPLCPHCKGTGKAHICPTCGKPTGDLDQDPDLEIGDNDSDEDQDDQDDEQNQDYEDDDEQDQDDDENEDRSELEDDDDDQDDDDAYTVDPDEYDDEPKKANLEDDAEDLDDEDQDEDQDDDENEDRGEEDEEDPDLDIRDDDEDDVPVVKKFRGRVAEDFGFGLDNAEDARFLVERFEAINRAKKSAQNEIDTNDNPAPLRVANRQLKAVELLQRQLNVIKSARNQVYRQLQSARSGILADRSQSPEQQYAAIRQLETMARENRKHFKAQAIQLKSVCKP